MNRLIKLLFYNIILSVFFSCNQKESIYSCDPEINEEVKRRLTEIRSMKRSDIIDRSMSVNRAYFRAFSKEQRADYWLSKIDETLELPWSEEEKNHLKKISTFIMENPHIYDERISSNEDTKEMIDMFFYNWKDYAKENLHWSNKLIASIVGTGCKLKNTKGDIVVQLNEGSDILSRNETQNKCDCNVKNDYCTGGFYCIATGCNYDTWGCGHIWANECNGECYGF